MLGVFAAMSLIALLQVPVLVRKKMWRELTAFCLIWLFATAYAALVAAGIPIPPPAEVFISIFSRLGLAKFLK